MLLVNIWDKQYSYIINLSYYIRKSSKSVINVFNFLLDLSSFTTMQTRSRMYSW